MKVEGSSLNGTPVFKIPATEKDPWGRPWGAVRQPDGYAYPAYFPFGMMAFSDLRRLDPNMTWEPSSKEHLMKLNQANELWTAAEAAYNDGSYIPLPVEDSFFDEKYPPFRHQRLGIARALAAWRVFFLWEMGTGKTRTIVEALRISRRENTFKQALVLAPPIVMPTWVRETERWSKGGLKAVIWRGGPEALAECKDADMVVLSYARARLEAHTAIEENRANWLSMLPYDIIVADESHSIGNWESEQTRAVLELSAKAKRRYALSGTAADNPRKLYPQLRFLAPGLMPLTWQEYQDRHLVKSEKSKFMIVGFKWMNELNARVDLVATRMRKKDCLDLPPMTFIDVPFDLGLKQKARYNELVVEMQASFEPALGYADPIRIEKGEVSIQPQNAVLFGLPHGAARVNKLMQLLSGFMIVGPDYTICDACPALADCARKKIRPYTEDCMVVKQPPPKKVMRDIENPKLEVFEQLLGNIMESDDTNKVLCWASFTEELDDMERACKKLGVGYVRVDGSNTNRIREWEDMFQLDPKCRVYIGQVKSGVGITLTAANYAIYYSLPWDPVDYKQSLERNNRPGQTRNMTVYRLLSSKQNDTIDRFIAEVLTFKDLISYTLVEKIACAQCTDRQRCSDEKNMPFRKGCKYQASANRPIAKVGVVR